MIRLLDRVKGGDITRFLKAKQVSDQCPLCPEGRFSLSVLDPDGVLEDEAPAIRVVHAMDDGSQRGYGEFLRVCSHCGFIHYIRDIEVLDFMEQEGHNGQ